MDHMDRKSLDLSSIKYLVFDEADQMLDMGFRDDMEKILSKTPKERQTVMFSATIPKDLKVLMERFQDKPKHINTIGENQQSKQINQIYFHINKASKVEALKRVISFYKISSCLIFCNTKMMVDNLAKELNYEKYSTACLHGDIDQKKREKVMNSFRKGDVEILIATDVAARGLDVNDLEAVINYDLPRFDQDYVHRIGRTGRAGKVGLALSLIVGREVDHIKRIADKSNMEIKLEKIPERADMEGIAFESIKSIISSTNLKQKQQAKYEAYLQKLEDQNTTGADLSIVLLKALMEQDSGAITNNINFEPKENEMSSGKRGGRSGKSFGSSKKSFKKKSFGKSKSEGGKKKTRSAFDGAARTPSRSKFKKKTKSSSQRGY